MGFLPFPGRWESGYRAALPPVLFRKVLTPLPPTPMIRFSPGPTLLFTAPLRPLPRPDWFPFDPTSPQENPAPAQGQFPTIPVPFPYPRDRPSAPGYPPPNLALWYA